MYSRLNLVFPFNLQEFCLTFHFPIAPTYNALKILELAGYIELTEEIDNPSQLMFTANKDELYQFRNRNQIFDRLIEVLLRSYTGVFTDMVHINEEIISQRLGCTRDEVYNNLIALSKYHIINYIPFKKTPFLIYTREREFTEKLYCPTLFTPTQKTLCKKLRKCSNTPQALRVPRANCYSAISAKHRAMRVNVMFAFAKRRQH